jgi:hypothetical protein
MPRGTIAALHAERKHNVEKSPEKRAFLLAGFLIETDIQAAKFW